MRNFVCREVVCGETEQAFVCNIPYYPIVKPMGIYGNFYDIVFCSLKSETVYRPMGL